MQTEQEMKQMRLNNIQFQIVKRKVIQLTHSFIYIEINDKYGAINVQL